MGFTFGSGFPLPLSLGQAVGVGLLFFIALTYLVSKSRRNRLPPGPRAWPVIGSLPLLGTMPHSSLYQLSKKYGPLMYLKLGTTDTVVASSPKVVEAFLKTNDLNFSNRPGNAGATYIAYDSNDLVWAPYGNRWRMLRKVCNIHLFAGKALEDMQPVRQLELSLLVKSLLAHGQRGESANLGELMNVCTANVLGQVMFSKRVFESQGAKASEFREMVIELMVLAGVFNIGDFVPSLAWLDLQGVQAKMKKLHDRFDNFFSKIIAEHQAESANKSKKDFLSALLALRNNADGEGGRLTDTDMKALLLDLFTAGTDTSSSTVEWAMSELIRHPHIMEKCQRELESVVGRQRKLKEADLEKLSYLQAVVKETFRLHPSTPLLLPRMAAEACTIEGYHIPKNARLMVNAWGIQRDPAVWTRPLEFDPERFVGSDVDVRGTDFEVIPFGAGRRICAGMTMGIRMVQLMLATLIHSFDWSLPAGQTPEKLDMAEAFGLTLQKAQPLLALPAPRLPLALYD
ncbi:flavonoid 3'-monooxygenase CYP75B137 [Cryptomeria japonica]|uniref:flavonoid 3'-monooxygenase CYP75B137 n=1 Tax=Cryptomeria japonica TaxID=3369 RepID=UPI0027D9F621|nr:flavonoid 3'-monooxygenase CYP75B137 [Cryptomeria japonica]